MKEGELKEVVEKEHKIKEKPTVQKHVTTGSPALPLLILKKLGRLCRCSVTYL